MVSHRVWQSPKIILRLYFCAFMKRDQYGYHKTLPLPQRDHHMLPLAQGFVLYMVDDVWQSMLIFHLTYSLTNLHKTGKSRRYCGIRPDHTLRRTRTPLVGSWPYYEYPLASPSLSSAARSLVLVSADRGRALSASLFLHATAP